MPFHSPDTKSAPADRRLPSPRFMPSGIFFANATTLLARDDKELAIADSNNQINKYRALLQYKKDLQRQYQRIKYNIRIGKDILPASAGSLQKD
jgi:hypothetical protein